MEESRCELIEKEKLNLEQGYNSKKIVLPLNELTSTLDDSEVKKLADQVKELENEKLILLGKIEKIASTSLDPMSEVASLLLRLKSQKPEEQGKAIDTLFILKDPVSFEPLTQFFLKDKKQATNGYNPSIREWYELFIQMNENAGIEFAISQFAEGDRFEVTMLNKVLLEYIDNYKRKQIAIPLLKNIALTNDNPSVRTYAKLLIKNFEKIKKSSEDGPIKYTPEYYENLNKTPQREQKIFVIFNTCNISHLFSKLSTGHNSIPHWRTTSFLFHEFMANTIDKKSCLYALEKMLSIDTSESSKGFNLYLLAMAEKSQGNMPKSENWLSKCKDEAPLIYDFFTNSEMNFDPSQFKL